MHPILFSIGPINIYSYGVILAAAFLLASHLASGRAHIFNISREQLNMLSFLFLIFGIIGARIFYILLNIDYFIRRPLEGLLINRGGLVFYGGFLLATVAGIIFAKVNKIPVLDAGDLISPFVILAHSIGRLGCFLNGCCYGKPTSLWLGVTFPGSDVKVYPTQLFSSAGLFIIFWALFYLQKRRRFKGEVLSLYLILYGLSRFFIDFLRGDLAPFVCRLTVSQLISIVCVMTGLSMYVIAARFKRL